MKEFPERQECSVHPQKEGEELCNTKRNNRGKSLVPTQSFMPINGNHQATLYIYRQSVILSIFLSFFQLERESVAP